MVYYPFYILLDLVCLNFVRDIVSLFMSDSGVLIPFPVMSSSDFGITSFVVQKRIFRIHMWINLYYIGIIRELGIICIICRYNMY